MIPEIILNKYNLIGFYIVSCFGFRVEQFHSAGKEMKLDSMVYVILHIHDIEEKGLDREDDGILNHEEQVLSQNAWLYCNIHNS